MPEALRAKALAYLARREHSRFELRRKLLPHAESEEALEILLDALERSRQLSDHRYAEVRVRHRAQRFGNTRLAQELRQAGIDAQEIEQALEQEEAEPARCQRVWQKKFGVLPASAAERMKQERFLQYRGFSRDAIRAVLQGLSEDGNDE